MMMVVIASSVPPSVPAVGSDYNKDVSDDGDEGCSN